MKIPMIRKAGLMALAAIAVCMMPVAKAAADKADFALHDMKAGDTVDVMIGKAEMITLKGSAGDVLVANPSIIDVMAVKSNQLYIVGSALGDTNIMVLDQDGNVLRRINVHVQVDTNKLEAIIHELYPDEGVKVKALTDQVILTGNVSTPGVGNSIARLVAQYAAEMRGGAGAVTNIDDFVTNMMTVAGEQQVMLKVKILEASRSALKDLGLETRFDGDIGAVGTTLGAAAGLGLTSPVQLGVLALNYSSGSFGPMSFLARALEEEGIVNTLAEPNLTAISGEQAGFLAGGEIPIPTEIDRNGNLIYEFRPFGVSLNFRPKVMSANRISMELTTEVSNATFDDNLQLQGINVPTFNVRRAETTVELPSGGTLMIAGLLQSDSISALTEIPGVKKVPVLGDLLKSDSFQRNETELVVMITPYLVKPFAQAEAAPPSPKVSGDLQTIPRLSMDDLGTIPDEDIALAAAAAADSENRALGKRTMAAPAGLSQEPILGIEPPPPEAKTQPVREKNAVAHVFENNIKRTYNSKKVDSVMKDMGSFGYMMD